MTWRSGGKCCNGQKTRYQERRVFQNAGQGAINEWRQGKAWMDGKDKVEAVGMLPDSNMFGYVMVFSLRFDD